MSCSLRNKAVDDFVRQHQQSQWFSGARGMRIHTLHYPQQTKRCVLIAPGRAEVAFKYQELAYDLWLQGYAVAVIDHRGQGLSQRFFADMQLGHMDDFQYAATDLLQFARQLKKRYQNLSLLAHSMGGAISCLALQRQGKLFDSAAISCPMLSLESGSIPARQVPAMMTPLVSLNHFCWWLSRRKPRFVSKERREISIDPFAGNRVTSSEERYDFIQQQLIEHSDYALGGPTAQWVQAAFTMMTQIQLHADKITTPLLILQGGRDQVVTPDGQSSLAMKLRPVLGNKTAFIHHSQGLHELLMEADPIRNVVLDQIIAWFSTQ